MFSYFAVVGAYPDGRDYDILRGEPGDRPRALENISKVPVPVWTPSTARMLDYPNYGRSFDAPNHDAV